MNNDDRSVTIRLASQGDAEQLEDAPVRRSGAGHRLMQAAEQWAREQGCWAIYLRSHVSRADAHQFYHKIGYEIVTSSVFRKPL